MRIIADTNVLLRVFVDDNLAQSQAAKEVLTQADAVIVGRHALCELAWVLASTYHFSKHQIANVIRELKDKSNVITDRAAVDAGLAVMDAGGDFADGVIDNEGRSLGGDTLVSFDKKAVQAIAKQGLKATLLA